jgi:hypothetical protein
LGNGGFDERLHLGTAAERLAIEWCIGTGAAWRCEIVLFCLVKDSLTLLRHENPKVSAQIGIIFEKAGNLSRHFAL